MKKWYKILIFSTIAFAIYFIFNAILIFKFSHQYFETKSDVAIVLGAGTANGKISNIFKERINHSKYLFDKHLVDKIILTGGYGVGQKYADSEIAKRYLISQGVPENVIARRCFSIKIVFFLSNKNIQMSFNFSTFSMFIFHFLYSCFLKSCI